MNADRCMKICDIIQETNTFGKEGKNILNNRQQWPEIGNVEFRNVSLKYRPTTELVL